MKRQPPSQASLQQSFVRPRRFRLEPALFALAGVAVVLSISAWRPQPVAQQAAPAEQPQTVAAAPRS